jgi:ribosome-associated toxin RatA of RatAB toxin-antitoxin module
MAEQTESSIVVSAPATSVMAVIADFEAYPQWNDEVKLVEILSIYEDTEQPAEVRFVLDAGAIKDDYVLEYTWVSGTELRWTLAKGDMLKAMDGIYHLSEDGGQTTVRYSLAVDIKIPMIGMFKRKAERVIIDRALKGLKERVEG